MWTKQLLILSIACALSSAFTHTRICAFGVPARQINTNPTNPRQDSKLSVLIYGWDGEMEEDDSSTSVLDFSVPTNAPNALAESISQDTDKIASLARLAAAFSPPERALRVEDIKDVHVVNVTPKHIEIVAMVCDGTSEGCISLFVPVEFKQECLQDYDNDDSIESCVRSNIDDLDVDAELMLLQNKAQQTQDDMGGLFGIYGDSTSDPFAP